MSCHVYFSFIFGKFIPKSMNYVWSCFPFCSRRRFVYQWLHLTTYCLLGNGAIAEEDAEEGRKIFWGLSEDWVESNLRMVFYRITAAGCDIIWIFLKLLSSQWQSPSTFKFKNTQLRISWWWNGIIMSAVICYLCIMCSWTFESFIIISLYLCTVKHKNMKNKSVQRHYWMLNLELMAMEAKQVQVRLLFIYYAVWN